MCSLSTVMEGGDLEVARGEDEEETGEGEGRVRGEGKEELRRRLGGGGEEMEGKRWR